MRYCVQNDPDIAYIFVLENAWTLLAATFDRGLPNGLLAANSLVAGEDSSVREIRLEQGQIWDVAIPLGHGLGNIIRVGVWQAHPQATLRAITWFLALIAVCAALPGSRDDTRIGTFPTSIV